MQDSPAPANLFRFGLFEADAARGTLTRNGLRVKIQDQPFRVLILLLECPGEIVSRDELRQKLWPEGTYVDFDGSLNVILKRLRAVIDDDSENPRFIETVPRRGYRFIAPVRSERVAGQAGPAVQPIAQTVAPAEAVETASPAIIEAPQLAAGSRHSHLYRYALVGVVSLVVLATGFVWRNKLLASASSNIAGVQMRKSVAVLGFHSLSGKSEDAWLATALSEMLSTELAGGEQLRLVSGEDVANLRIASPWSTTDTLDQRTTARIGSALSGDLLVLGSYTTVGNPDRGQLRLDVRMQDARSGEILTEIAEIGSSQDLFRLVSRVGMKLRDRLGVPHMEGTDEAGVLAAIPLDPDAARFYALGLVKMRQFDVLAAKDLLLQATQADPKFSLGHAMLAHAWGQLGYGQKNREEAKKALDLSTDLPRANRMLVEGEYYDSMGNQEQAASTYRVLFELFPDNVEYGLRLASANVMAGNASQGLDVIHRLRALPAPASADPRIDLAESRAIKDNKPAALVLVRSAVSKASSQGKKLVYALARKEECMNLLYGEHPEEAVPACEDAYNIFVATGNRAGAADALRLVGDYEGFKSQYDQAIATYEKALAQLSGLGEHAKTGAVLNNMAGNYLNQGNLDRAEQLYEQAKFHFEQTGDKLNTGTAICNIADILFLRGDLPGAKKAYEQTLALAASTDRAEPWYAMYRLADLDLAEGHVQDAHRLAQQAIDQIRPIHGAYGNLTSAMTELGEILETEGDLAGARKQFQSAMEIQDKMGEKGGVMESQAELADLALEEGNAQQAESLIRPAIVEFQDEKSDPSLASAYTVLSRALLMQGKAEDARQAIDRAIQFSRTSSDPALRLPAAIQEAQVEMAGVRKDATKALEELHAAITSARKLGYYNVECEARLTLGKLQLKSNAATARAQLTALAAEARNRGLELLARRTDKELSGGDVVALNAQAH